MNLNALKTLVLGSGLLAIVGPWLINLVMGLFGCTGDILSTPEIEVAMCTGGDLFTIPVGVQKIIGGIVISIALILTGWFKGGTVKQNLMNQSVPVVKAIEAKPGVVTATQVAAEK